MAVFTYGLKSTQESFTRNGLTLVTLSDLESLLSVGVGSSVITPEQQRVVQNWALNPQAWAAPGETDTGA
jgi:hypothetical protein